MKLEKTVFAYSVETIKGEKLALSEYKGKVLLIVNTASKCGFTPQYKGLEALHKEYEAKGLVVLAFPCNQFANQEPGEAAEIISFCELNYGVSFPVMAKLKVNGPDTHPLFRFLKTKASGLLGGAVKWNFTKFLVSKDGTRVRRFGPVVEPKDIRQAIEEELGRE